MHRLDPIERLPHGSLFRLTPGQLRSVRGLTKRCCNFSGGDCLLLDGVCPQHISRSLLCRWFRRAVLPQQPKLEQSILNPKRLRRCEVCGAAIRFPSQPRNRVLFVYIAAKKGEFSMDNILTVPIHLKMTLTAREAAEYSNIGINKIDSMLRAPNCPFVLFVGTKKLVKRKEFEDYISHKLVI